LSEAGAQEQRRCDCVYPPKNSNIENNFDAELSVCGENIKNTQVLERLAALKPDDIHWPLQLGVK
jgi:hypothetical protein